MWFYKESGMELFDMKEWIKKLRGEKKMRENKCGSDDWVIGMGVVDI